MRLTNVCARPFLFGRPAAATKLQSNVLNRKFAACFLGGRSLPAQAGFGSSLTNPFVVIPRSEGDEESAVSSVFLGCASHP